jgi:hypothetical protein
MRILFLLLFVAALNTASGQTRFGLEAGANFAQVGFDRHNGKWGPHAGLFAQLPGKGRFSFRTGIQYSLKGLEEKDFYAGKGNLLRYDFHYLSVPLTASYKLSNRISLSFGPVVNYLLASRVTQGGKPLDLSQDGDDGFPDWDLGLQMGLSYTFKNGFGLYTRYERGFANMGNTILMNDAGASVRHVSSGSNRTWQLGASYLFPMRRGQ